MSRRLPLLVEQSLAQARTMRTDLANKYDLQVKASVNVACHKGCHHCCYHPITVSLLEAVTLYRWLQENGIWNSVRTKMQEMADQTRGLSFEVWMLSLIPCPLLQDGVCRAYEARPFACRVTYAVGDPHYCHPHRLSDETGILPKGPLFQILEQEETNILRRHRLGTLRLPLAQALLYGEQIARGDLELESLQEAITNE